jgi:hypothetical protein
MNNIQKGTFNFKFHSPKSAVQNKKVDDKISVTIELKYDVKLPF